MAAGVRGEEMVLGGLLAAGLSGWRASLSGLGLLFDERWAG
jgi:hypothetical protein